jgi:hypothetical protein
VAFIDKNKDEVARELEECLMTGNEQIAKIWSQ